MQRRVFLRWAGSGIVFGVIGCVPGQPTKKRMQQTPPSGELPMNPAPPPPPAENPGEDPSLMEPPSAHPDEDAGPVATDEDASAAEADMGTSSTPDAGTPDSGEHPDAEEVCTQFVELHDTYAQALYFDGTYGPLTGTITVQQVMANVPVEMEFWHGHGGVSHRFTVTPEHFAALKRGERAMIQTTTVEDHEHLLFVDPVDESYRVPGAQDVQVPNC